MSWKSAQEEAWRWLDRTGISHAIKANRPKSIDLRPHVEVLAKHRVEGKFRNMTIEAARRILKSRNVEAVLPEDFTLDDLPDDLA